MTLTARATSGDSNADRRYAYAQAILGEGDAAGAADLARQTLELVPAWAPAWHLLGRALAEAGDATAAADAFRQALVADPDDTLGAGLELAALGEAGAMSRAYVASLFDAYAPTFEAHLSALEYRAPALLADSLRSFGPFARALDLGCGTGLMGAALRGRCDWLGGCDLSPAMVAQARARKLYDRLDARSLEDALEAEAPGSLDLAVAADVFVYVGALERSVEAAHRALAPGGILAFSVQDNSLDPSGWRLGEDRRFHHGRIYLDRLAESRFAPLVRQDAVLRRDGGRDVPGLIMVLRKI